TGDVTDLASGATRELTATLQDAYGNTVTTGAESEYEVTFTLGGEGSASNFGPVAANSGVAKITLTGEEPGNVTVLAIIPTVPPLVTNPLMFIVTVDKTRLLAAIEEARDLTATEYSVDSWKVVETALAAAELVYTNVRATQLEIDTAEQVLREALANLGVDKSGLQSAITEAEGLTETDYSTASWSTFESALTVAETVNDDADATQSEIDVAEQALRDALANLGVDKVVLQTAITETEVLVETDYSPASWAALQEALEIAQTVFDDPNATQS